MALGSSSLELVTLQSLLNLSGKYLIGVKARSMGLTSLREVKVIHHLPKNVWNKALFTGCPSGLQASWLRPRTKTMSLQSSL